MLLSCKAKYIILKETIKEKLFLKGFFEIIDFLKGKYNPIILINSQLAMVLTKNPIFHKWSKHIDI